MVKHIDKDLGESFCNTLRQIAFTKIPVLRPIGFSFGSSTTIVSTGNVTLEDSIAICNALAEMVFVVPAQDIFRRSVGDVISCSFTLHEGQVFRDVDLVGDGIQVFEPTGNPLFHVTNFSDITFTVYFCYRSGRYTSEENRATILQKFPACKSVVTMSSRHCNVSNFSIEVKRIDYAKEEVEVTIETVDGTQEADIWKTCLDLLIALHDEML